jgi:putative tryptophan/tyrosine transport system substrate-binding protein
LRTELKRRGALHSVLCWGEAMKNFLYLLLIIAAVGGGAIAEAQQPKKIPQIGLLAGNRDGPSVGEFQRGLRDLGYVEGKNILIEYRYMEGKADSSPSLVTELVQLKVNILVVTSLAGNPCSQAGD